MAKLSFEPQSPRSVLNVYAYLTSPSSPLHFVNNSTKSAPDKPPPDTYLLSAGDYQAQRIRLLQVESYILRTTSFNTHVALPHALALTYLTTLGMTHRPALAMRVFALLNGALLSPQLLYLSHQPNALAVAAVYLAARETGVKLVEGEWWEVFDVDREELGFLVVGMQSVEAFARSEKEFWGRRRVPLTAEAVEAEIERRRMLETGE